MLSVSGVPSSRALPALARDLHLAAAGDRQRQAAAVLVEQAAARITRLVDADIDQVDRTAMLVRPVLGQRDVVVRLRLADVDLGRKGRHGIGHRVVRVEAPVQTEALAVGRAEVAACQAGPIERVQRRQVQEGDVATGDQGIAQRRQAEGGDHGERLGEVRPAVLEGGAERRHVDDARPTRRRGERERIAGKAPTPTARCRSMNGPAASRTAAATGRGWRRPRSRAAGRPDRGSGTRRP